MFGLLQLSWLFGASIAVLVWALALWGGYVLVQRQRRLRDLDAQLEAASDLLDHVDKARVFAWSVGRRWDRPVPGPDDPPRLYILPGGEERTNSCEVARRAWLSAASDARDLILDNKFKEAADLLKVNVDGRVADHEAMLF